jgi:hypothetical protein
VAPHVRRGPDRDALRAIWPTALGVVPFGLLIGAVGRMHLGAALGLGSAATSPRDSCPPCSSGRSHRSSCAGRRGSVMGAAALLS